MELLIGIRNDKIWCPEPIIDEQRQNEEAGQGEGPLQSDCPRFPGAYCLFKKMESEKT